MGVDCRITLPSRARIRDVATVIAIVLGNRVRREPLGSDGWHVEVDGTEVTACGGSLPECAQIKVHTSKGTRWFLYHFEFSSAGGRGMLPRSTAENIAMCKRLVDFFGGSLDYADCDDIACDYWREERFDIHGEDDGAFYRKQERFLKVEPLSKKELDDCEDSAAYKQAA